MRRTILLVVAVLTLAAVFTTPATAAPDKKALTWAITCPELGTFEARSPVIVPGWLEGTPIPVLLMGGTFTEYPDGIDGEGVPLGTDPVPPGLPRLVECSLEGPLEVSELVYRLVADPVYMLFPTK